MRPSSPDPTTPPQVVPRPPSARPGAPAPWAVIAPGDRRGLSIDRALAALSAAGRIGPNPPPDDSVEVFDAQPTGEPMRSAAVLVALSEEQGEARVLLTRRATTLRSHQGEISFPGGRIEPGEGPADAARREAWEEVCLDPATVRPVGWLRPVRTFVSTSLVLPVVAVVDPPLTELTISPAEVARVFDVALADLVAEGAFSEERWRFPDRPVPGSPDGSFPVRFFHVAGELVWGATARMLFELLCLVLGLDAPGT